jgi:TPR repeat protein
LASNIGNTDAMNDLAFCYKHGHGLEKDDFKAAQLHRLAEKNGNGGSTIRQSIIAHEIITI